MLVKISQRRHGKKDILDHIYAVGCGGRIHLANLVGPGRDASHCLRELVDRIPQRLVLKLPQTV